MLARFHIHNIKKHVFYCSIMKIMKKSVPWIVIPAFNASHTIVGVVRGLRDSGYNNIVVVDDGSRDGTYESAVSTGVDVVRHVVNRGQGASLQTGIRYSLTKNPSVVVTFDADGQHDPSDISSLMQPVLSGDVDIALGSRFLKSSNVPLFRKIALKCGIIVVYLFNGLLLTDAHNGIRCLSNDCARNLEITSDRMEHASEIIEIIKKKGWRYKEVPVTVHYSDMSLRDGQSTLAAFRILGKMFWRKMIR